MDYASRILVVEDEPGISGFIGAILAANGYDVEKAVNGKEALMMISSHCPDAVVLDLGLPDIDGQKIIASVREWSRVPILVVSARAHERDKITAFDLGADDYITKPFRLRELLMRIRAVMRRAAVNEEVAAVIKVQNLRLDNSRHEVRKDSELIDLTPLEFALLTQLMESAGKVIRRQEMSLRLMDNGYAGSEATIKIHIRNLRQKLGDDLAEPTYIETVFGVGYRFLEGES